MNIPNHIMYIGNVDRLALDELDVDIPKNYLSIKIKKANCLGNAKYCFKLQEKSCSRKIANGDLVRAYKSVQIKILLQK
jgi:hypothetical protein